MINNSVNTKRTRRTPYKITVSVIKNKLICKSKSLMRFLHIDKKREISILGKLSPHADVDIVDPTYIYTQYIYQGAAWPSGSGAGLMIF